MRRTRLVNWGLRENKGKRGEVGVERAISLVPPPIQLFNDNEISTKFLSGLGPRHWNERKVEGHSVRGHGMS